MRGSHAPRRATHASVPRRPVTISACCPAASAGLPVPTSFRCGGGPSCPHEQGARGQQPGGEQGQQVAAGAGDGRAPEPETAPRIGAKAVVAPAPPGVSPRVPGIPEVPVLPLPGVPTVSVRPGVVPGGVGAMIPPVLMSPPMPTSTPMSTPAPGSVMPPVLVSRTVSRMVSRSTPAPLPGVVPPAPQLAEASPRTSALLPQMVTGTDGEMSPMPASTWLPEARLSSSEPVDELPVPAEVPPGPVDGWAGAQAAEASPRTPMPLPQTVTGIDGEMSPASTSTWLPEAIGPDSRTPMPAGASPARGPTSSSRPARGRDRVAVASALGLVSAAAAARARRVADAWPDAVVAGRPRRVPIEMSVPAARGTRTLGRIAPEPSPPRPAWTVPPARSVQPSSLDRTRPSAQTRTCSEVGRPRRTVASAETSWASAAPAPRPAGPRRARPRRWHASSTSLLGALPCQRIRGRGPRRPSGWAGETSGR